MWLGLEEARIAYRNLGNICLEYLDEDNSLDHTDVGCGDSRWMEVAQDHVLWYYRRYSELCYHID
jgi:hypothetical protein